MRFLITLLILGVPLTAALGQDKEADRAAKWEKEIAAVEKRQADHPPAKGGIVFAGSSTIRLWDIAKAFPDWSATNSGFGGSEIRDVTIFADRVILRHEPRAIVFYAGDNDINSGRSPEQVLTDYRAFVEKVHNALPKTRIYFIAIKPSPARWAKYETQSKANALIKELGAKDDRLIYVDVVPALLGRDGQPREELYVKDRLHLSPAGYEVANEIVRRAVK
ncbi:MAG TPA: GDSL-type esterase/lipase family protein [Gemmataceae bacterium]|nr:GDSL-type esterase/lipase family protein [Gemmataceae bacterium]